MTAKNTIPAEAERPCDCCGRIHRKLYSVNNMWMGSTCKEQYTRYWDGDRNPKSLYWNGYQKQYQKVARMFGK